ncbi:50S ribosomal protein L23 [Candidatus Micrarchaeota archaeon CG10_big_fil_rev_8_21_14_0_10_45_29]|nr:MAG: 50S ribosomal protein L23 [Candidatus Micrarchaeota archaeon CG10_big_fil_rev_8_21_14_0_10_45_29]
MAKKTKSQEAFQAGQQAEAKIAKANAKLSGKGAKKYLPKAKVYSGKYGAQEDGKEGAYTAKGTILLYPITTEKAIAMIEFSNQLTFVVSANSTKPQIKREVEALFKVKVGRINTKITPKGKKHAYIKLKEGKADDIASQLKIV